MRVASAVFLMAAVTYISRVLPLTVITTKFESPFLNSFLYYIPFAVLGAMTFPSILFSTSSTLFSVVGLVVGLVLAYYEHGLFKVAMGTVLAVYLCEILF